MLASSNQQLPVGPPADDCFAQPDVGETHDRNGDIWITPVSGVERALRHESSHQRADRLTAAPGVMQARGTAAADDRFARPDVAELTIELATKECLGLRSLRPIASA